MEHVVEEIMLGPTKVKFCDDKCKGVTKEEGQKILKDALRKVRPYLKNNNSEETA